MITITSVGGRTPEWSVALPGSWRVRLRTAAMAMAALPKAKAAARGETGDRMIGWGMHSRVTGDSHGSQPSKFRPFGFRLPASGSRLPMAGMPTPEWLMS